MGDQFGGAGGHADARRVAEVATGGGEVEPVIFGQFGRDEAGHGRFAVEWKDSPERFADGADGRCGGKREVSRDGFFAEGGEELVDPIPEDNRLAVGDEVGAAARRRGRRVRSEG